MGSGLSSDTKDTFTQPNKFTKRRIFYNVNRDAMPPVDRLKHDMKTHCSDDAFLRIAINEFDMYYNYFIDYYKNHTGDDYETEMKESLVEFMLEHNQILDSFIYNPNEPLPLFYTVNTHNSVMTAIKDYKQKRMMGENFHGSMLSIMNKTNKSWIIDMENSAKCLEFCSYINGNNQIYIDLLTLLQGWIQYVSCYNTFIDETIVIAANERINIKIEPVKFKKLNDFMNESGYNSREYTKNYGEAKLYFFMSNQSVYIDVSHEFYDPDGRNMNDMLSKSNIFDWDTKNPLKQTWLPSKKNKLDLSYSHKSL